MLDGEWNASALHVVVELTQHRMLSAQIVGYSDTGIPEIHLYSILGPNVCVCNIFISSHQEKKHGILDLITFFFVSVYFRTLYLSMES